MSNNNQTIAFAISSGYDDSDSQEETDETEDDFEQTSPLLQQIRARVSGALSAIGMSVPGSSI